jgi:hypothetical protein
MYAIKQASEQAYEGAFARFGGWNRRESSQLLYGGQTLARGRFIDGGWTEL